MSAAPCIFLESHNMSKVLTMEQILEAALAAKMPGAQMYVEIIENMTSLAAKALAGHLSIQASDAVWEGPTFGGCAASFGPLTEGDECPFVITHGDPTGDWEMLDPLTLSRDYRRASPIDPYSVRVEG